MRPARPDQPARPGDRDAHAAVTVPARRTGRSHAQEGAACSNDFKKFLFRGNVIDLAVAVIIGAAFTAIVTAISRA